MQQPSTLENHLRHATILPRPTGVAVRAVVAVATLIALLSLALAQDNNQQARTDCMTDYRTHCAGVRPGEGRVRKCMMDNFDKLTDACKQAMNARAKK